MYVWVGLHGFLNRRPERGRSVRVKCELEGNGGKDELDVIAVAKSGAEEARSQAACTVAPVRDCLSERRFPHPCLPAEP